MPNARQTTGNQRLLQQNLAKIRRTRTSSDKRLAQLIDHMERHYTETLGADGYHDLLGKTPLETLLRRYRQTPEGKRAMASTGATPEDVAEATRDLPAGGEVPAPAATPPEYDDPDEQYYERYSTDIEQTLVDERDHADPGRRAEINEELDAIQTSRMRHLENDLPFDDLVAEDALRDFRHGRDQRRRQEESEGGGMPVSPAPGDADLGTTPVTTPDNPTADATTGSAPATEPRRSRHGQGAPSGDGDGPASAGMADPFDPNGMRTVPATHARSAGSEVATHESHGVASSLGNVSASGRPTEAAEAPRLDGDAFPGGATGDDSDGESGPGDGEGSDRGSLSSEEKSSRGSLSAQGEALGDDPAAQAQKEAQRKKDKTKRRMLMHLALQAMPILGPFLAIVLAVVLLASCIESLLPGSESDGRGGTESAQSASSTASGTGSGTGAVTRRGSTSSSPQVDVDRKGLAAMFADEGTASEGKEDGDEEGQSDGELSDKQKRVIEACKTTPSPGAGWCAAWVGDVFGNANVGVTFRGDARDWWHAFCDPSKAPASCEAGTVKTDSSRSKLKPAMIIAVASSSSGTSAGATYGHIGIYVGGGQVMHNIGSIATCSVDEWINTYGQYADVGWGWADGIKLGDGEGGGGGDAGTVGDGLGIKISSQKDIKKWAKLIDAFLEGRPLAGQGQKFAEAAAKYGIDPRLSPSMSIIESGGGQILCAPYNAWGVTSNGTPGNWASYDSWDDAIDKHAKLVSGSPYHIPFTREDAATYCSESYWDGDPNFCLKTFAEKCGRGERA